MTSFLSPVVRYKVGDVILWCGQTGIFQLVRRRDFSGPHYSIHVNHFMASFNMDTSTAVTVVGYHILQQK